MSTSNDDDDSGGEQSGLQEMIEMSLLEDIGVGAGSVFLDWISKFRFNRRRRNSRVGHSAHIHPIKVASQKAQKAT